MKETKKYGYVEQTSFWMKHFLPAEQAPLDLLVKKKLWFLVWFRMVRMRQSLEFLNEH